MSRFKKAFTIVELLIVIVVIGVLATISVVAYNGIREKAVDTKRGAAIDQYVKVLNLYAAQNGALPTDDGCLGDVKDYPAKDGFAEGVCYSEGPSRNITVNNVLNTKLKTISQTLPDASGSTFLLRDPGTSEVVIRARGMWYISAGPVLVYYDSAKNGLSCPKGVLDRNLEYNVSTCQVPVN